MTKVVPLFIRVTLIFGYFTRTSAKHPSRMPLLPCLHTAKT
jgi:hypothetical protein